MSNIIRFELPKDTSKYFASKILYRGKELYQHDAIIEAYAINEHHAYVRVKGTVEYTVSIEVDGEKLHMECNCPYERNCKHEVAALLHIQEHPLLELKQDPMSDELSVLDDFHLYLSEVDYKLSQSWHDNLYVNFRIFEQTISMILDHILSFDTSVFHKTQMVCMTMETFPDTHDVWHYFIDLSKINLEEVKRGLVTYIPSHTNCFIEFKDLKRFVHGIEEMKLYQTLFDYLTEQIPPFLRGR